jgi:cyclopropane-fatty-acyl-phospholipid synthase
VKFRLFAASISPLLPRLISSLIDGLKRMPIAIETDAANEQHYELPPEFFVASLGPNLK